MLIIKMRPALWAALACSCMAFEAAAATHTWIPRHPLEQPKVYVLPGVEVTGHIDWGTGSWDNGFSFEGIGTNFGSSGMANAVSEGKSRAFKLSSVCSNPGVTADTKQTTGLSDLIDRYLAAVNLFQTIEAAGLYGMYQAAYGATGIVIIIDSKKYGGFKVTYADGATETWVVTPNHTTSSVKLFDTPAPDSLQQSQTPGQGCKA